ncbi:CopG family ribbon-helix-helix protein [Limnobacter alexandrii]|uniref:CopG family ribbon-helix-helix protein n=1 Tax=Limnobacter alexandrii TaxID=2570352 RepID=UPI0014861B01|nr:ribbon-helix-helix domain-containing protein [Limnobacter alexandrii]
MATDKTRVITAHVPEDLANKVDEIAEKMDRSKAWIVKQALNNYVAEEQAKYEMTLDAIRSVEEGNFVRHEDILKWIHDANSEALKSQERKA